MVIVFLYSTFRWVDGDGDFVEMKLLGEIMGLTTTMLLG